MTNEYHPNRREFLETVTKYGIGLAATLSLPRILTAAPQTKQAPTISNIYNPIIDEALNYFESMHGVSPGRDLVKAMIAVESGATRDAFRHDPMQIANQGDFALDVLINRRENTNLIGDFSRLKGKTKTPWRNKNWDYGI